VSFSFTLPSFLHLLLLYVSERVFSSELQRMMPSCQESFPGGQSSQDTIKIRIAIVITTNLSAMTIHTDYRVHHRITSQNFHVSLEYADEDWIDTHVVNA
jgi:hypothetical protein